MTQPLPKWLLITLHVLIIGVTVVAAATQIPAVFTGLGLPVEAHAATLAVTYAGLACTYFLKSPLVLGWLSVHDPEDVAIAAAAETAKRALKEVVP